MDHNKEFKENMLNKLFNFDDIVFTGEYFCLSPFDDLEYHAILKGRLQQSHGILYVFSKHLAFYSKLFGYVHKLVIPFLSVITIHLDKKRGSELIVHTSKGKVITRFHLSYCVAQVHFTSKYSRGLQQYSISLGGTTVIIRNDPSVLCPK